MDGDDRQTQVNRHVNVENRDTVQKGPAWEAEVMMGHEGDKKSAKFIEMTNEFEFKSDGHLRCRCIAKHCIESTSDKFGSVHCAPYRPGLKPLSFEKTKMDQMLKREVMEASDAKWDAHIFLVPKKHGSL